MVIPLLQHNPKKLVQAPLHHQLVSLRLGLHRRKKRVNHPSHLPVLRGQMLIDPNIPVNYPLQQRVTGVSPFWQHIHVKYNTVIDAVFRCPGVEGPAADKYNVPCLGGKLLLVQGHVEAPLADADNLILHVPVEGHHILGMPFVDAVYRYGEIKGAVLLALVVGQILHFYTPR